MNDLANTSPEQLNAQAVAALRAKAVAELEMLDYAVLDVQDIHDADDLIFDGHKLKIEVYSSGSDEGVRAAHKVAYQAQLRSMGLVRGKVDKKYGETSDKEEVDRLVAHTKSIIHPTWPFSARETYENHRFGYIGKQVSKFIAEDGNFAKPSTPS